MLGTPKGERVANPLGVGIKYRGVSKKVSGKYCARIGKIRKHLGTFDTPEQAARAYDKAARQLHGPMAILNFPSQTNYQGERNNEMKETTPGSLNEQASEGHLISLLDEHLVSFMSASTGQSTLDADDDNDVLLTESSSDQQGIEAGLICVSDEENELTQRTLPTEESHIPKHLVAKASSNSPLVSLSNWPRVTSVLRACKSSAQNTMFHPPVKLNDSTDVHIMSDPEVNDKEQRKSKPQPSDIPRTGQFTYSGPGDCTSAAAQACTNYLPIVKFHDSVDIDIRSDLLPTLDTLRNKHGNLIGEDTVRSKKILSSALHCLAEAVIMLKNTSPRTLLDSQVDELKSVVSDLQRVGLKVDWLVPIVDKALALLESKEIMESLIVIEKAKAEVDEKERQFLAESAKVKQELEEGRACLSARISSAQLIDLDQCLGEGIL